MSKDGTSSAPQEGFELLDKTQTVSRLYQLLDEAQKFVFLVTPYLSIEKLRDVERKLRSALNRKVSVVLIIRAEDASTRRPSEAGVEMLRNLVQAGLALGTVPDLHAKIYMSERRAIITSLNLLDSSFNNSIEVGMGMTDSRPEFKQLFSLIQKDILPNCQKSVPFLADLDDEDIPFGDDDEGDNLSDDDAKGHCIRCGTELELDTDRPYCEPHYAVWARFSNPDYTDRFCHGCGDEHPATKNKPFCRGCYREHRDRFGL
ncbi:phospholipase D-like domain-containing protein [Pyxidicoccus xibeiensis]|uniref:phospholipase D-like domain-containing protein n=1 Tax=Pyxidicoccus xibeiensis TaxID=2906759 RepID=UPI0020A77213|nr:phospholipase D-like domain-containing protein [Pyxidicoccus xibeiensis]MCP3141435.1 phospholipase D-like domain-containing protein [Pyxidicoccus xibeiensis]